MFVNKWGTIRKYLTIWAPELYLGLFKYILYLDGEVVSQIELFCFIYLIRLDKMCCWIEPIKQKVVVCLCINLSVTYMYRRVSECQA